MGLRVGFELRALMNVLLGFESWYRSNRIVCGYAYRRGISMSVILHRKITSILPDSLVV
jgi:hypothetical protein